jgi:hypothetical protein
MESEKSHNLPSAGWRPGESVDLRTGHKMVYIQIQKQRLMPQCLQIGRKQKEADSSFLLAFYRLSLDWTMLPTGESHLVY